MIKTLRYKNVQIYVDPKDHKKVKKKLKKEFGGEVSLSQFCRVAEELYLYNTDFLIMMRRELSLRNLQRKIT
jgi:hypothetical protein